MNNLKVLSLFDGISCGLVALDRVQIPVKEYHSCEVDKSALLVSRKNHGSRIIQHGDVTKFKVEQEFDLLIGGSPCQGFSTAGLAKGFEDPRSKLFWEYIRILQECLVLNPNVKFLLENVSMKKEWINIISTELGVTPVCINSALISAQLRKRLYWANWQITQPDTVAVKLSDILINTGRGDYVDREKSVCLLASYSKQSYAQYAKRKMHQVVLIDSGKNARALDPIECERLQTLPDNYTEGVSKSSRYKLLGNCWTVDVIAHIFSELKRNTTNDS